MICIVQILHIVQPLTATVEEELDYLDHDLFDV